MNRRRPYSSRRAGVAQAFLPMEAGGGRFARRRLAKLFARACQSTTAANCDIDELDDLDDELAALRNDYTSGDLAAVMPSWMALAAWIVGGVGDFLLGFWVGATLTGLDNPLLDPLGRVFAVLISCGFGLTFGATACAVSEALALSVGRFLARSEGAVL